MGISPPAFQIRSAFPNHVANLFLNFDRELLWAVYGIVQVLESSPNQSYRQLGLEWQEWLDYTKTTVAKVPCRLH